MKFYFLLLGIIFAGETLSRAQFPPDNDDFANRIFLSGNSVTLTGNLANATWEKGEPYPENVSGDNQINGTVWWSWTASESSWATIQIVSLSTNTLKQGFLEVRTGTDFQTFLTLIKDSNLYTGRSPFLTFPTVAGTVYHIRLLGPAYGSATIKLTSTNSPVVILQPTPRTVRTNESTFFGVLATGGAPLSYQWQFNGTNLVGATAPILSLDNIGLNQVGNYSVLISNSTGVTISDQAALKVVSAIPPVQIVPVSVSSGNLNLNLDAELHRYYRVQSSTNLSTWEDENHFPVETAYLDPALEKKSLVYHQGDELRIPVSGQQRFFRVFDYAAPNDICINNLRKIRFAKEIWSLERQMIFYHTPTMMDLFGYFKNGIDVCPLDPSQSPYSSYILNSVNQDPICMVSLSHALEERE